MPYEAKSAENYSSDAAMNNHEKTESVAEQTYEAWMGGSPANTLDAFKKWKTSGDN